MYRMNDKPAAIEKIQYYLRLVGNPNIFVAPTGIYDENTRLSVVDFQKREGLSQTGIVDLTTFNLLYKVFNKITERDRIRQGLDFLISFPLYPGESSSALQHINGIMRRLLDHYGQPHSLRDSNFYSKGTSDAVGILRKIYLLPLADLIDEELYGRMISDFNSIFDSSKKTI